MNERIRELVGQAGIPVIDGVWDYNDRNLLVKDGGEWRVAVPSEIISTMIDSEKGLEKFAELIVRECAEWVNDNLGLVDEEARKDLLKHFGVGE